jgi:hypothetical protein
MRVPVDDAGKYPFYHVADSHFDRRTAPVAIAPACAVM